ncbi:MAG: hypothetical protein LBS77_03105 [Desulfovibrio sp.]|jgi:hypothetical protein|nr:hypothetical protein [Desulfovibrio sp.]
MEKLLSRLAHQLDALDEASLMSLWSKYATIVERFEPTKHWEEAALIFSIIQAKRWKNQLFNYHWSLQTKPGAPAKLSGALASGFELERKQDDSSGEVEAFRCRVLPFTRIRD